VWSSVPYTAEEFQRLQALELQEARVRRPIAFKPAVWGHLEAMARSRGVSCDSIIATAVIEFLKRSLDELTE
jgi:hypothetical protein